MRRGQWAAAFAAASGGRHAEPGASRPEEPGARGQVGFPPGGPRAARTARETPPTAFSRFASAAGEGGRGGRPSQSSRAAAGPASGSPVSGTEAQTVSLSEPRTVNVRP